MRAAHRAPRPHAAAAHLQLEHKQLQVSIYLDRIHHCRLTTFPAYRSILGLRLGLEGLAISVLQVYTALLPQIWVFTAIFGGLGSRQRFCIYLVHQRLRSRRCNKFGSRFDGNERDEELSMLVVDE